MTDTRADFLYLTLASLREAALFPLAASQAHGQPHHRPPSPDALREALRTTWN